MANPYHHAVSSARRWGGSYTDYIEIHSWFDESKGYHPDFRHRALRHHAEGIFFCETIFGKTITNSNGRKIPVRWVGEQHVKEDLGFIPSVNDWLREIKPRPWMNNTRKLPIELEEEHNTDQEESDKELAGEED